MAKTATKSSRLASYKKDYYGGALMMLIGIGAVWHGATYHVGKLDRMGAGFFPVLLGAAMVLTGVAIAGMAKRRSSLPVLQGDPVADENAGPQWRGWFCILASIGAFVLLGKWGGLLPASFAITFIAALGDRDNTWRTALGLAVTLSAVSVVVFWWALQLQFPLFTWG
ncbi:tripartite tricarboxylate transporter TctB family protein [Paraburkholderia tropica]|uniref:tripartite tricarboxylate transporter TctB family protein n=1 Tax=Paraburkholderia tropica TaxID=92647 RepID=UPI002AB5F4E0|nr:tripartite tricarboxylate transporter TctB family protein [Paraburkholderia tropica]